MLVAVGQHAEHRGAEAAHAEGEAEEQAGHHADPVRHQFLRVDHDRREGRGEDRVRSRALSAIVDRQARVGQGQRERQDRRGSTPQITVLRPIRSPTGPPISVPAATAPRNTKRQICAVRCDSLEAAAPGRRRSSS